MVEDTGPSRSCNESSWASDQLRDTGMDQRQSSCGGNRYSRDLRWNIFQLEVGTLRLIEKAMMADRNFSANIIVDNAFKLGWKPTWDTARFYENIDDEVVSVLELGKAKSSLIDSLFLAANAHN